MKLGTTVITRGIAEAIRKDAEFGKFIIDSFGRYLRRDWGDTCEEDWKLNDEAVKTGEDRIVARYDNIFIITEWDRLATTILFTEEY